ncbi:MAG: dihydrodipicolinate synthase family protein [bacterium]
MKRIPGGVYAVLPTPLDDGERLDEKGLAAVADALIKSGVHGIVVLGSGGEFPYLTHEEKKAAIEVVAGAAAGRAPVVAGAGAFGTGETILLARHAEKHRADALLVPLPLYYRLHPKDVIEHFRRIAGEVGLPIIYYHYPEVTRLDLAARDLARLFEIENVVGVKESVLDLKKIKKHKSALPSDALIFAGTILMLRPLMKSGACGCICPIPSIAPRKCVEFHDAVTRGDSRTAERLEREIFRLLPIFAGAPLSPDALRRIIRLASDLGIPMKMGGAAHAAVKEALRLAGHSITAVVKSPLPQLTEKQKKRVRETLAAAGLL